MPKHSPRTSPSTVSHTFRKAFGGSPSERIRFCVFIAFLGLCVIGGGASRPDVMSLLYLRPAAVLTIAVLLIFSGRVDFRPFLWLFVLLGGFALLMVAQLVPLPPAIWTALPAREPYSAAIAGSAQVWRPLSLTPDLTLNSLVTLVFPLAGLIGFASIRPDQRIWLVGAVIAVAFVSAILGIAQVTSNPNSPIFLYRVTHEGGAVGFFSNRNHQAVLLALALPLLRVWTLMPSHDRNYRRTRGLIALGIGLLLIALIIVTGSRAGLVLGVVGLIFTYLLSPRMASVSWRHFPRTARTGFFVLLPILVATGVFVLGRATAIQRLVAIENLENEPRVVFAPITFQMARDFWPVGTGFGAFDRIFRGYEPDATLDFAYFNHAHNDFVELVSDGGLPALLLLLLLIGWWLARLVRIMRTDDRSSPAALCARAGAAMMFMFFLSSVVEYPLRVPLMMVIFTFACGWSACFPTGTAGGRWAPDGAP